MEVRQIIHELESLQQYIYFGAVAKRAQEFSIEDVRFSYYRLSSHVIDSTIHLLLISYKNRKNDQMWHDLYKEYKIQDRGILYGNRKTAVDVINDIFNQYISNSYFNFMFNLFEHAFRVIARKYDSDKYDKIKSFHDLFESFMKDFNLFDERIHNFIDYAIIIRNSIHNNGKFVSPTKKDRTIVNFDNDEITIKHDQIIEVRSLWYNNIKISDRFLMIYNDILLVSKVKKIPSIEDSSVLI